MGRLVNRRAQGSAVEARVRDHLEKSGFQILTQNFRWRGGEADIVALAACGEVVIVEVRSSKTKSNWLRQSISFRKRRRLECLAHRFRLENPKYRSFPIRFDFCWVEGDAVEIWKNVCLRG